MSLSKHIKYIFRIQFCNSILFVIYLIRARSQNKTNKHIQLTFTIRSYRISFVTHWIFGLSIIAYIAIIIIYFLLSPRHFRWNEWEIVQAIVEPTQPIVGSSMKRNIMLDVRATIRLHHSPPENVWKKA